MKTQYDSLERATVKVSNLSNEQLKYDISAEVAIVAGKVESISNGQVKRGEELVATFNRWNKEDFNYSMRSLDRVERDEVHTEIEDFIEAVEAKVAAEPIEFKNH